MRVRRATAAACVAGMLVTACSPSDGIAPTQAPNESTAPPTTAQPPPPSSTTTTVAPPKVDPDANYAVIVFANHLPAYGRDETGAIDRPWARLHTTRDYLTMTRLVEPTDAKIVLSFSPTLLAQIDETAQGQLDRAAQLTLKPAAELTDDDKSYIERVFFTASPSQYDRFPRYQELAAGFADGRTLSFSDYRDLQVLFNLAWTSPLLLAQEPLLSLAARGRGYTEEDKQTVLDVHVSAAAEFLDSLQRLHNQQKIELATAPLADPVLPLLIRNRMSTDAQDHIASGRESAAAVFGIDPTGLVPHRGLIDQANVPAIGDAGYDWVILEDPEAGPPSRLVSEQVALTAFVGGTQPAAAVATSYFTMNPDAAALDFVRTLATAAPVSSGSVTTVVIDGTEPWGRYEQAGVPFLASLLRQLGESSEFTTALPTELVAGLRFDPGPNPSPPDSYLSESAELAAWAYLGETRRQLLRSRDIRAVSDESLEAAYRLILESQDNTWFRYYRSGTASEDDAYYDALFRQKLRSAWELLDAPAPDWVDIPLHAVAPIAPTVLAQPTATTITIDNRIDDVEWSGAGRYDNRDAGLVRRLHFAHDTDNMYVRVDFSSEVLGDSAPGFDLYLGGPDAAGSALTPAGNLIGFAADRVVAWRATNPVRVTDAIEFPGRVTTDSTLPAGFDGDSIEFALPLNSIAAQIRPGDQIGFRLVDVSAGPEMSIFPSSGHGRFAIANLEAGTTIHASIDPLRDDYGPGSYTYLADPAQPDGAYDLAGLDVRHLHTGDADTDATGTIQFEITMREELTNPWSAPGGFSLQTIDLYVDANPGTGAGAAKLLPGRLAATVDGSQWDYAATLNGWDVRHFSADVAGTVTELTTPIEVAVMADRRKLLVTVDRASLPPGDPGEWQFTAVVLANQAIPTLGIHELRPLAASPDRFNLGGGTIAINDPMIMDLLHPESGAQEAALVPPREVLTGDPETIGPESLARIPFIS